MDNNPQDSDTQVPQNQNSQPTNPVIVNANPVVGSAKPVKAGLSRTRLLALSGVAVLVILGTVAYVFGYYAPNRPKTVFNSALTNTGRGYDEIVKYVSDKATIKEFETSDLKGNFKFDGDGFATDGTFTAKSDDKDATFAGNIGLGVTRLKLEGVIKDAANSESPDLYFKLSGIKGLGAQFAMPELDTLDGQWVAADHSLFDNITKQAEQRGGVSSSTSGFTAPTEEAVVDAIKAVGETSKKYLFTNDEANSVIKMDSFVGKEVVDSKSTNHYKVKASKENLKTYVKELGKALDKSKLNDWAKDSYDKPLSELINSEGVAKSADTIDGNKSFDLWVNTKTKLVHKVRLPGDGDAAKNYTDIGLNYGGGAEKPFFITTVTGQDGVKNNTTVKLSLNTETNLIKMGFNTDATSENGKSTGKFDIEVKPSSGKVEAKVPEGAITLAEALDKVGLVGYLDLLNGEIPTTTLPIEADPFTIYQ